MVQWAFAAGADGSIARNARAVLHERLPSKKAPTKGTNLQVFCNHFKLSFKTFLHTLLTSFNIFGLPHGTLHYATGWQPVWFNSHQLTRFFPQSRDCHMDNSSHWRACNKLSSPSSRKCASWKTVGKSSGVIFLNVAAFWTDFVQLFSGEKLESSMVGSCWIHKIHITHHKSNPQRLWPCTAGDGTAQSEDIHLEGSGLWQPFYGQIRPPFCHCWPLACSWQIWEMASSHCWPRKKQADGVLLTKTPVPHLVQVQPKRSCMRLHLHPGLAVT